MADSSTNFSHFILIGLISIFLIGSIGYGTYNTFGAGAYSLTDSIAEHALMHKSRLRNSHSDYNN